MNDGGLQTINTTARNCFYTGIVTNHKFSRVAISMCKGEMVGQPIVSLQIVHMTYRKE